MPHHLIGRIHLIHLIGWMIFAQKIYMKGIFLIFKHMELYTTATCLNTL